MPAPSRLSCGLVTLPPRAILERAEIPRERLLLFVGDVLAVEHQHRIAVHAGVDRRDFVTRQRLCDVDARDLADEHVMQLTNADGHADPPVLD